jgi:hypothetical protein
MCTIKIAIDSTVECAHDQKDELSKSEQVATGKLLSA